MSRPLCARADVLSGRALFSYDPSLFVDDEGAADDDLYVVREDGEDGEGGGDASESGMSMTSVFVFVLCTVMMITSWLLSSHCRPACSMGG